MAKPRHAHLSRRERQIMDVLYRHGRATVADVQSELPEPPSYSAVRALLRILETKGHARHEQDGPRYVYVPTVGLNKAKRSALKHLLDTFFQGSAEQVVAALLEVSRDELSEADLSRLRRVIDQARGEAREGRHEL